MLANTCTARKCRCQFAFALESSRQKTDVEDAQWIQTLHSYGLLKESFRPQGDLVALRTLLRHRAQLLEHRAPHILHIQKALLQVNIQLSQAVTDVMGMTGQKIIRSIVKGERNARVLAGFRDSNCKHSEEEIEKALTGTWREEHLYILRQCWSCTTSTQKRWKPATRRSIVSME